MADSEGAAECPHLGGGRGGRGGPQPPEKLRDQFDEDKDGKLTGAERPAALSMRGGGNLSSINEENLRDGVQSDMQVSRAASPKRLTFTLRCANAPYPLSSISPRRLVRTDGSILSHGH